jgi:WD40 repeat protein
LFDRIERAIPKKKIMIFISSTFTDTHLERNILHHKILPQLQQFLVSSGLGTQLVFYDMRFGVKDESTLDHTTWTTCRDAIQQCYEESNGIFFLSLLGEKYGYCPLPKYIDEKTMAMVLKKLDRPTELTAKVIEDGKKYFGLDTSNDPDGRRLITSIRKLLDQWYLLDENNLPPRYELKNLKYTGDPGFFQHAHTFLGEWLFDSLPFEELPTTGQPLLMNHSVTEWESLYALSLDRNKCHWIRKTFDMAPIWANPVKYLDLCDTVTDTRRLDKLEYLKSQFKCSFDPKRSETLANVPPDLYLEENTLNPAKFENLWEADTEQYLLEHITRHEGRIRSITGFMIQEIGIPTDLFDDIHHHFKLAFKRSKEFYGRTDLLEAAIASIMGPTRNTADFESISLAIFGKSGLGKTSLMSKLAVEIRKIPGNENIPIIIRFCGTSKYSLNGLDLMFSICAQLLACYNQSVKLAELMNSLQNQSFGEMKRFFDEVLEKFPAVLIIDSLDQLTDQNEERSNLSILKGIRCAAGSKIVVSCLPDESNYHYNCETRLKQENSTGNFITVEPIQEQDIQGCVDHFLRLKGRQLSPYQREIVMNAVLFEPTILYIHLAVEIISSWKSYDRDCTLTCSVKGLIHQLFADLERNFGQHLTSYALSFITFSRGGVNDEEMRDLLSCNEDVMREVFQYNCSPDFPMHVWLRLKHALKGFIVEKESQCIQWYNRQLRETATERYKDTKLIRNRKVVYEGIKRTSHQIMGRYFGNLIDPSIQEERIIRKQPLCVNMKSIWNPSSVINRRRALESAYHLFHGGLLDEAINEMCSLEFVCVSCLIADDINLLQLFKDTLGRITGLNSSLELKLSDYFQWFRKYIQHFGSDPRHRIRLSASRENFSSVKKDFLDRIRTTSITESESSSVVCWNHQGSILASARYNIMLWDEFGVLLKTIGSEISRVYGPVGTIAWSLDDNLIAVGLNSGTIQVRSIVNGDLIYNVAGHIRAITSLSWNSRARLATTSATGRYVYGNTIKVWKEEGGIEIGWNGHDDTVTCVCWLESYRLLSSSNDATLKVWNSFDSTVLKVIPHHSCVHSIVCRGGIVAVGSWDRIDLFDSVNVNLLRTIILDHLSLCMDLSPDGSWVASCGSAFCIYNTTDGKLLERTEISNISSVSWSKNGIIALSVNGQPVMLSMIRGTTHFEIIATGTSALNNTSSLQWNIDGSILASVSETSVVLWNPETSEANHFNGRAVACSSDLKTFVSIQNNVLQFLNTESGDVVRRNFTINKNSCSVAWNSVYQELAIGTVPLTVLDVDSTTILYQLNDEIFSADSYRNISWSSDGSMLACTYGSEHLLIWDRSSKRVSMKIDGDVDRYCWHRDCQRIAVDFGPTKGIEIWDVFSNICLTVLCTNETLTAFSWCSLTYRIASVGNGKITIWDGSIGERLHTLQNATDINLVEWSPNGDKLASCTTDGIINLWMV